MPVFAGVRSFDGEPQPSCSGADLQQGGAVPSTAPQEGGCPHARNAIYIAVMAAVSYAIRVLPLTLIRKPIKTGSSSPL